MNQVISLAIEAVMDDPKNLKAVVVAVGAVAISYGGYELCKRVKNIQMNCSINFE